MAGGMQLSFADDAENTVYADFVRKFKVSKTTDDCYTPEGVYRAVAGYVCQRYKLDEKRFVRPFYPGGDYQRHSYGAEDVVVDNPPFSIISSIAGHYQERRIPFFLFAPGLMLNAALSNGCTYIACGAEITYDNGAKVRTSFITNLEPENAARSAPELYDAIMAAQAGSGIVKKSTARYEYDAHIMTAAMLNYLSNNGEALAIPRDEGTYIPALDEQRRKHKNIFGGGILLTDRAAEVCAAAKDRVGKKNEPRVWGLSAREKEIVRYMGEKAEKGKGQER